MIKGLILSVFLFSINGICSTPKVKLGFEYTFQVFQQKTPESLYSHLFFDFDYTYNSSLILDDSFIFIKVKTLGDFQNDNYVEVKISDLYFSKSGDRFDLKTGYQIINWSETFGINIMDIVNPRDYSYGIFGDLEDMQKSVFTINYQLLFDKYNFQFVFTPKVESDKFPDVSSVYSTLPTTVRGLVVNDFPSYQIFNELEYGLKINYLADNGIDLNFIYFFHQNRNPIYEIKKNQLYPVSEFINSYGITCSKAFTHFVLRGDLLLDINSPYIDNSLIVHTKDRFQTVMGLDYQGASESIIAFQSFYSSEYEKIWLAFQYKDSFLKKSLDATFTVFKGIYNNDVWITTEIVKSFNDSMSLLFKFDLLDGKKIDLIGQYRDVDRISLKFNYFY